MPGGEEDQKINREKQTSFLNIPLYVEIELTKIKHILQKYRSYKFNQFHNISKGYYSEV